MNVTESLNTVLIPAIVSTTFGIGSGVGRVYVYLSATPRFVRFCFVVAGVKNGKRPYTLFAG